MAVETDSTPGADPRNTARQILDNAIAVTVLTGAGISTDSGIPDFRGPNGVWTKNPEAEKASNIRHYVADPEVRKVNWERRASGELWADVEPNDGHRALVTLERNGKLHTLITQNVDELHQRAGSSTEKVVEIHGSTRKVGCLDCDWRAEMNVVLDRVRSGEEDPHCEVCGGILKSATVSFGQSLIADDLRRAEVAASECDVFLAIGSSLAVYPINESVALAKNSGAALIIINMEPTPYDRYADVVLRESISEVLPDIL
ncbi:MAG: NAD-dependent deacetylase [Acidimicrobiaceae bacterium]|jgi:NAD-dependent deacetylase|nr:NAD-dependent deacetylase [Acidimicrobiaceae bacterium]MBT5582006.1 NAD-dependent deacetylase [Acidimicrobiaceae bacterium]MBT5850077.1 NAD-dependent deacetylase [Acidimicrobiaceae bacterium]